MKALDRFKSLFHKDRRNETPHPSTSLSLPDLVTLVADEPSLENRDRFYRALSVARVGASMPAAQPPTPAGPQPTAEEDQIGIPTVTLRDGSSMLLVYCDIPGMTAAFPREPLFEIDARVALEMAQAHGYGVIVKNMLDGKESWAAVAKEDVAAVLAGKYETRHDPVPSQVA